MQIVINRNTNSCFVWFICVSVLDLTSHLFLKNKWKLYDSFLTYFFYYTREQNESSLAVYDVDKAARRMKQGLWIKQQAAKQWK